MPEARQQRVGQIALISTHFPPQSSSQGLKRLAGIGMARCHLEDHGLVFVMDVQMELEAKNPPMVVPPRWASPGKTRLRLIRALWQRANMVLSAK